MLSYDGAKMAAVIAYDCVVAQKKVFAAAQDDVHKDIVARKKRPILPRAVDVKRVACDEQMVRWHGRNAL